MAVWILCGLSLTGKPIGLSSTPSLGLGIAISPDGDRLVTAGGADRTAKVWDTATRELLQDLELSGVSSINTVSYSPDGSRLIVAGEPQIGLFDAAAGNQLSKVNQQTGATVQQAAFRLDGKFLVTTDDLGYSFVWDVSGDAFILQYLISDSSIACAAFSLDSADLATGGLDGFIRIWDPQSGDERALWAAHDGRINAIVYHPDGWRLASASSDGTAKIWDVATGELLLTISTHPVGVEYALFSPDGKNLITAHADNSVRVHVLELDDLVALAHERLTRGFTEAECQQYLRMLTCPDE